MATDKQKIVAEKILENLGSGKSLGEIMREAGYSEAYSKNPQQLKATKGWGELMDKHMPEDKLAKTHGKTLEAVTMRKFRFSDSFKRADVLKFAKKFATKPNIMVTKVVVPHYRKGEVSWEETYWEVAIVVPDNPTILKSMDMAYKLRGSYDETVTVQDNRIKNMSDSELDDYIAYLEGERNVKKRKGSTKDSKRRKSKKTS